MKRGARLRARQNNLLAAYEEVGARFSRFEILWFLRGYLGRFQDIPARDFLRDLVRRARGVRLRPPAPELLPADGASAMTERRGRVRSVVNPSAKGDCAQLLAVQDWQSLLATAEQLAGRGSGSQSVRIESGGASYFLKRYVGGSPLRSSRARRVWLLFWRLRRHGIPLPEPLVLREESGTKSYLLIRYAEGYRPLSDCWPGADRAYRKTLLVRTALLLGRLHRLGWIHGDFNWNNILVGPEGDLLLVDLDCAKPLRWFTPARPFRDVQHFLRDLLRPANQGEEWKEFFLLLWQRWSGVDASRFFPGT